jgi:hypothetical protein
VTIRIPTDNPQFQRLYRRIRAIFIREPTVIFRDRRNPKHEVRRHESQAGKWRVMKGNKHLCTLTSLRRASDMAQLMDAVPGGDFDRYTAEWHKQRTDKILRMIRERKEKKILVGAVNE